MKINLQEHKRGLITDVVRIGRFTFKSVCCINGRDRKESTWRNRHPWISQTRSSPQVAVVK